MKPAALFEDGGPSFGRLFKRDDGPNDGHLFGSHLETGCRGASAGNRTRVRGVLSASPRREAPLVRAAELGEVSGEAHPGAERGQFRRVCHGLLGGLVVVTVRRIPRAAKRSCF